MKLSAVGVRVCLVLLATGFLGIRTADANPAGATVSQGTASFTSQGSQLTIQTSGRAFINWQSFNIGQGETTTFIQPSSTSLVWNQINDPNPSQILGNLNANGYVVLQNQSGFYIGGQASINTRGLLMTTAPLPMPDLSSGGPWDFNLPPPSAKIVNYGQINGRTGGSIFLIANDIENNGSITAPGGNIGLYSGKEVLVSERPNGLGLSAQVTLPQGSVDNSGKLIADAGTIAMNAKVVNQGGLVRANSIKDVNGTIELVAGDSLTLGPQSVIEARGDTSGTSAGGSVTLQSGNSYQDAATSVIDISGGGAGGNGGQLEVSATQAPVILSSINAHAVPGFSGGQLTIDPTTITLDASQEATYNNTITTGGFSQFTVLADTINLVNSWTTPAILSQLNLTSTGDITLGTSWTTPGTLSQLSLTAGGNIFLNGNSTLSLTAPTSAGTGALTMSAGNSILLGTLPSSINPADTGVIQAGNGWSVNLTAGTAFVPSALQPLPAPGNDGIYLVGTSCIHTTTGNIDLMAANEVQVGWSGVGNDNAGTGSVTTGAGGSIQVTTQFGDVNTGANNTGYTYVNTANPVYYTVSSTANFLGGISTAAGGDVDISAGGNVRSFLPSPATQTVGNGQDAGTGAFGPEPGNVTISAVDNVYGHYVLANGTGKITAQNDIGGTTPGDYVALSLVAGSWTLDAPHGSIYLQEVRDPNGLYNTTSLPRGSHATVNPKNYFDYDPNASLTLDAGIGVEFVDSPVNLPRLSGLAIPPILPPILNITAGAGGVTLDDNLILFPSANGGLQITTTPGSGGSLTGAGNTGNTVELLMSDSGSKNFTTSTSFGDADHGITPLELNDPNPVTLSIDGSINGLSIVTAEKTTITVGGDVKNSSFSGQNLHSTDKTTITVTGTIFNSPAFSSVPIPQAPATVVTQDLPSGVANQFDTMIKLAVDPVALANLNVSGDTSVQLLSAWGSLLLVGNGGNFLEPSGFAYNTTDGTLSFLGQMNQKLLNLLNASTITVVRFGSDGLPVVDATGHLVTDTYNAWVDTTALGKLITESAQTATSFNNGLRIGGPGEFDINAGSIQLGNSYGILSVGALDFNEGGLGRYANLASITPIGADVNVTTQGNIELVTSTIASLAGGDVTVRSSAGAIDLGSADALFSTRTLPLGAFVTGSGPNGPGNINVSAYGNVDIDSSRVAAYDGGSVTVESDTGNVNAGNGGATAALVETHFVNPVTGVAQSFTGGVYGNGILATTLVSPGKVPGSPLVPGNITVTTPQGDIEANLGGILQEALNGDIAGGPTITLTAGSTGHPGNIDLGDSGVIGGTVNLTANGNINGLIISRQNSSVNAAQNFTGTVLSGGSATVAVTGSVSGTIVGVGGASVSGGSGVTAQVLGQNVSVNGGAATSTLGTSATATTAATAASASSTDENQQQVAGNTQDDDPLKKKGRGPLLARRVGRVTVILPNG